MRLGATWSSARAAMEQQALEAALTELRTTAAAPSMTVRCWRLRPFRYTRARALTRSVQDELEQKIKDAHARAASAEAALAAVKQTADTVERARAAALSEAEAATARAAAAETAAAELQQKLRDAEASLAAVHTMDAAATVEEVVTPTSPQKTDSAAAAALVRAPGAAN
jgi:chromosome segregation ATPase